ncbi:Leucine--tRNA ligase [Verrucomicrobia bacterium]|nr:Leucine--tRNA ligase [Verrucomicrobiota bacterium]
MAHLATHAMVQRVQRGNGASLRNSVVWPGALRNIGGLMAAGRRQYPFHLIEPKWQRYWEQEQTFRAWNPGEAPPPNHPFALRHSKTPPEKLRKFYVLDMFPYPSGAGLHVGHPEGPTATDILARYRRARGEHVMHPMGWDAFGLPAEQYAIRTGQHPRETTKKNIATFKRQIQALGFSYDWTREIDTTDPSYFKWTQWIFLKIYNSWFNPVTNKAEPIETLVYPAELQGRGSGPAGAADLEVRRRAYRDAKRLAYVTEAPVWWCEHLGTVLANEEVVDGKSEVGGFPVVRKPMRQWMLRITAYAERLLQDLVTLEWSEALKQMQRNWIGRSEGAEVDFAVAGGDSAGPIRVFTTRPDTLFGATYLVLAPEKAVIGHWLAKGIVPEAWPAGTPREWTAGEGTPREAIRKYQDFAGQKSDLERTELVKEKTGIFTGVQAINPVNGQRIPIWIADYVLATYGTGAIMAVPGHDTRDLEFAQKFGLPIVQVVQPSQGKDWQGYVEDGVSVNSANNEVSLNGLATAEAKRKITAWLEAKGLGESSINYKLRDWLFSRQRYWGEPFPIVWKTGADGRAFHEALPESALPLLPPALEDYKPTADGQPPLARAKDWVNLPDGSRRETNTMPQWAGSCWYYLRYLDPHNGGAFCGQEIERYWMGTAPDKGRAAPAGVDLYVGGAEHAVLHLLYARFWHKVLFDLGYVSTAEPFYKLVNQGLILGEDSQKMSKSRGNVINPDELLEAYGADAFRLYEMFMGPLDMVKPWSTEGLQGVYKFLGRVWRLFIQEQSATEFEQSCTADPQRGHELLEQVRLSTAIQSVKPTTEQLKVLHACIKKVTEDIEGMRFNVAISALMIFINAAMDWKVKSAGVLREFLILLQPFAPHLAEELWSKLSNARLLSPEDGALDATIPLAYQPWPEFDLALLAEDTLQIPVQVNGKLRDVITVPADASQSDLEAVAKASEKVRPFLEGKKIKRVIVVPKKLVSIVLV